MKSIDKLKLKQIRKNIFHIKFPNQYLICSTFLRLQEFYESPYKQIRGHFFTLENIQDVYAKHHDNEFTYLTDWSGFNVPDNVIKHFFELFNGRLLRKESQLKSLIQKQILDNPNKTYLIATYDTRDESHEISHGYWYLEKEYRTSMMDIIKRYSHKNMVFRALKKMGYPSKVHCDELQAYLSTDTAAECRNIMLLPKNWKYTSSFRRIFKKFDTKHKQVK